jgi:hypothetical protein
MNTGKVVGIFDFEPITGYMENETPIEEPAPAQAPEVETTPEPITEVPAETSEPVYA